jgi:hypothetical protein
MDIGDVSPISTVQPGKTLEYRQRAEECRTFAYEVDNEGAREELLNLAAVWMSLAEARHAPPR